MTEWSLTETSPVTLTAEGEAQAIEAARGDPRAFSPLYRAYVRPVYRYLYSRLGQAGDAEDLTSQVFAEALASLPRYRHRGHFLAWLFSIARHRLLNHQHRRPLETDLAIAERLESPGVDPLSQVIRDEERQHLLRLIQALKEEEQDLLRLRFVAELRYVEIGALLGRSEAAVKKQVYRLLARLEIQLEAGHD
jgi:RNA polymerase sigma-70 factor (ECF subfamily)